MCSDTTEWLYKNRKDEVEKAYAGVFWDEEEMGRPYGGKEDVPELDRDCNGPCEEEGQIESQPDIYATLDIIERLVELIAPCNRLQAFHGRRGTCPCRRRFADYRGTARRFARL